MTDKTHKAYLAGIAARRREKEGTHTWQDSFAQRDLWAANGQTEAWLWEAGYAADY